MIDSPYLVVPGRKFKLRERATDDTGQFKDKADAARATLKNLERLDELQELLYAESKRALLVVFQAMDAGGKDGAIEHLFSGVNPQGCSVTSFKDNMDIRVRASVPLKWGINASAMETMPVRFVPFTRAKP